jgi:hypothetical protein
LWWLPGWRLTPRGAGADDSGQGPGPVVSGRSGWGAVAGRRLPEASGRRRHSIGRGRGRLLVCRRHVRRGDSGVGRNEVNGRSRRHGRLWGSRRLRSGGVRLIIGFLRASPAELSPQCIIAVGHCFSSRCRATRAFGPSQVSTTAKLAHRTRPGRGACASLSKLGHHRALAAGSVVGTTDRGDAADVGRRYRVHVNTVPRWRPGRLRSRIDPRSRVC